MSFDSPPACFFAELGAGDHGLKSTILAQLQCLVDMVKVFLDLGPVRVT